jgi:FSR family fosmidomycin resistance protein-like MFS transporter
LYAIIPVAGIFIGSTQSIIVVTGQRMIPGGMALATGLVLALTFSSGALGTYLCGYLADLHGFEVVFQLNSLLVIAAAALALTLSKKPPPAHASKAPLTLT